jgi:ribonuclease-3
MISTFKQTQQFENIDHHNRSIYNDAQEDELSSGEIRDRILNERNKPITEEYVNGIFQKFGLNYRVKHLENFQRAMIHSSYLESNITNPKTIKLLKDITPINKNQKKYCMPLQPYSYERLEFLGDSIIRHALGKYLYMRYQDKDEGFLTTNRSKMENKDALSILAKKLGIQDYAVISRTIEIANGRISYITLTEDIFEAFIGAVNSEMSDDDTVKFIWLIIENEGDVEEVVRTHNNYKDQLMQYFHKIDIVKHDLEYIDREISPDHTRRRFQTIVKDKQTRQELGIGSGKSKKTAQQRAAKDALIKLNLIGTDVEEVEYYDIDDTLNIEEELKKTTNIIKSGINDKQHNIKK